MKLVAVQNNEFIRSHDNYLSANRMQNMCSILPFGAIIIIIVTIELIVVDVDAHTRLPNTACGRVAIAEFTKPPSENVKEITENAARRLNPNLNVGTRFGNLKKHHFAIVGCWFV